MKRGYTHCLRKRFADLMTLVSGLVSGLGSGQRSAPGNTPGKPMSTGLRHRHVVLQVWPHRASLL